MLSAGIAALVQRGFFALPTNDNYGVARTGRGRWRPRATRRGLHSSSRFRHQRQRLAWFAAVHKAAMRQHAGDTHDTGS
jgi:hypothetical protein